MTEKLKVRHTGNAGVLLYIEEKALGIDALCHDPEGIYRSTSEEEKRGNPSGDRRKKAGSSCVYP